MYTYVSLCLDVSFVVYLVIIRQASSDMCHAIPIVVVFLYILFYAFV